MSRKSNNEGDGYFWVGSVEVSLKPENTTRQGRALKHKAEQPYPDAQMLNKKK